jgi:hypothetical protein
LTSVVPFEEIVSFNSTSQPLIIEEKQLLLVKRESFLTKTKRFTSSSLELENMDRIDSENFVFLIF